MYKPQVGEFYKDFKGNIYRIIPCPKYSENGNNIVLLDEISNIDSDKDLVWYQDIKTNEVYNRDLEEFFSPKVFEKIENGVSFISDGYHTFDELYQHRNILYLNLLYYLQSYNYNCWKSKYHYDGSSFNGWFIVGINLSQEGEDKQISYHLPMNMWNLTSFLTEEEKAPYPWDGHTSDDVLNRLIEFIKI